MSKTTIAKKRALQRAGKLLALGIGGFVLLTVGLVAFVALGGNTRGVSIEARVADDTVRQYQIAKRSGDAIAACVQAGLVVAAYLQAKDETNYGKWRVVEAADCRAAGVQ